MHETIPDECQLCKLLDHNDDIREPEGSVTIANENGGTKFIYCCQRCPDELFDQHDFSEFEDTNE